MGKFTFKKHPKATGLAGIAGAGREYYDIKLQKKIVGLLASDGYDRSFDIRFMVWKKDIMEDKNPNCKWKWITLKYHPLSVQEAKDFLAKYSKDIQDKFKLYIDE